MTHGDDNGLILPPAVAPIQTVVVPIAQHKAGVIEASAKLAERLKAAGLRVKLDDSDNTPGWKFAQYEMKGVPLRVELGPRDIENNKCVLVRRDTGEKLEVSLDEVETKVKEQLDALAKNLYARALENRKNRTYTCTTLEELKATAEKEQGFYKTMWCGDEACEIKLKEELEITSRCMPFEQESVSGVCPVCGKPAKTMIYWGKAY
jgi:prolyl-tRNA synthetase